MRGLIMKDLLLIRKNMTLWLVYLGISGIWFFQDGGQDIAAMMFAVLGCMMGIGLYTADETSGSTVYIRALPVSARQIVTARYAVQLGIGLFGMAVGMIFTLAAKGGTLQFFVSALTTITVCISLASPLMFRFGSSKGRLVMLAVTFGVLGMGYLIVKMMHIGIVSVGEAGVRMIAGAMPREDAGIRSMTIAAIDAETERSLPLVVAGITAACAALTAASWAISCRIVKKKGH